MIKKKIIKIGIVISIICLVIGMFIAFLFNWNTNPTFLYMAGSSSVHPLIEKISKLYYKDTGTQIISGAGGSGVGIQYIVNNKKNVGLVSKTPSTSVAGVPANGNNIAIAGKSGEIWEKSKIKTATIAWDGMALIYKLPPHKNNYPKLVINKNNILDLFRAFAGFQTFKLSDLQSNLPQFDIKPFARVGGAEASGTAESFFEYTRLVSHSATDAKEFEALKNGSYGSITEQTAESNLQAFQQVNNYNTDSNVVKMVYLSAGFVLNNIESIENSGFVVAAYQAPNEPTPKPLTLNNIANGYNWYRPFNLLFRVDEYKIVNEFFDWYYKNIINKPNSELYKLITSSDYKPIDTAQFNSMCLSENGKLNFFVSDYQLLKNPEQYAKRKNKDTWYGAL